MEDKPKVRALALETVTTSSDHINHATAKRNEHAHSKQKPGVNTMTEGIYDESPHRLASTKHRNMRITAKAQKSQTKRKKLGHSQQRSTLPLHDSLGPDSAEALPFGHGEDLKKLQHLRLLSTTDKPELPLVVRGEMPATLWPRHEDKVTARKLGLSQRNGEKKMRRTAHAASMQDPQATHTAREGSNSSEEIQIPRNITIETKAVGNTKRKDEMKEGSTGYEA